MTSDPAFTSLKPSEVLLGGDDQLQVLNSNNGLDVEREFRQQFSDTYSPLEESSCGTNVANSECSRVDDSYINIDDDRLLFPEESGLASCIINVEDVDSVFDPPNMECLDWEEPSFSSFGISPVTPLSPLMQSSESHTLVTNPPSLKRKNIKAPCCQVKKSWLFTEYSKKKWSKLTQRERRDVVEDITLTISQNLSLREQLEVFRIIKPRASISISDTEFVIDIKSITEKKLTKIREYIHTHSTGTYHTCDVHKKQNRTMFTSQKKSNKKQKTTQKRASSNVPIESPEKKIKQKQKEKRSGLFTMEEVVNISKSESQHEDIDVDVLE